MSKRYYRFQQLPTSAPIDPHNTEHFALTESDGLTWVYMPLDTELEAQIVVTAYCFGRYEEVDLKEYIDWGVQWESHAPGFKDYTLQVDLAKYSPTTRSLLHLKAGPGFGDLSHPTTRLTLAMMAPHVAGKDVLDIGCGSGILTLAALLLGARSACGLDIDREALQHAKQNADLNGLKGQVTFLEPKELMLEIEQHLVILMNMIRTQQQEAWAALPQLHQLPAIFLTSGILFEERDRYLKECATRGWDLIEERREGDWMGFQWRMGL